MSALRLGAAQAFAAAATAPPKESAAAADVEDLIADRDADARAALRRRPKHAERQILDRKIAVRRVGGLDKASPRRIVRLVEGHGHARVS